MIIQTRAEPPERKRQPPLYFLVVAGAGAAAYFWRRRPKSNKALSKDECCYDASKGNSNSCNIFSDKEIVQQLENEILSLQAKLGPASNYERRIEQIEEELEFLRIERDVYKSDLQQFHLKMAYEYSQRKSMEAEADSLKEEYQQRVSSLERKVCALTKERDYALTREQVTKSDASALLKEKDEIITQVMAEGKVLSKKQADQDAIVRELRAQIREFEEETRIFNSKLQMEEAKVENIKRAQKDFYTSALNAAKEAEAEAEAVAESRANNAIKNELETRLREAAEKEMVLVKNIEQLRHAITRKEQEAAFKEEIWKRDIDDIQERYQASELRYNELVTQVSAQIEAMQETAVCKAEAWAGVERSLRSRLQDAEAKAAAAEENERSLKERLLKEKEEIITQFTAEGEELSKKHAAQEATIQKLHSQIQERDDELRREQNKKSDAAALLKEKDEIITQLMAEGEELSKKRAAQEATIQTLHSQIQERDDALRREQNKRSDAAALLKEKDETITQLMAEGEELSKKRAAQEATIQKLCAQIQEFEEEKQIDSPPPELVMTSTLPAPTPSLSPTPTSAPTHLPTSPGAAFGAVAHGRIGGEIDAEELHEIKRKQKQIGGMAMEEGKLGADLGETVCDAPPSSLTFPTPPALVTTPTPAPSISPTPTSVPTHLPTSPAAAFGAVPDGRIEGEIDAEELHAIKRKQKQIGGMAMEEGELGADLGQTNGHILDKVPPTPVPTLQSTTQSHGLTVLPPQSHGPTLPSPLGPTHLPTLPVPTVNGRAAFGAVTDGRIGVIDPEEARNMAEIGEATKNEDSCMVSEITMSQVGVLLDPNIQKVNTLWSHRSSSSDSLAVAPALSPVRRAASLPHTDRPKRFLVKTHLFDVAMGSVERETASTSACAFTPGAHVPTPSAAVPTPSPSPNAVLAPTHAPIAGARHVAMESVGWDAASTSACASTSRDAVPTPTVPSPLPITLIPAALAPAPYAVPAPAPAPAPIGGAQEYRLHLGGIPFKWRKSDLLRIFSPYGAFKVEVAMCGAGRSRSSKGFGFLSVGSEEVGLKCIKEMHGSRFGNKNISVRWARDQRNHN